MISHELSAEHLRSALSYDPSTGNFRWVSPGKTNARLAGKLAGSLNAEGYWKISVGGVNHLAHRLVFLHVLGRWPVGIVDHINGVRVDNRFSNLRETNDELNAQNRRHARKGNTSGFLGVSWDARSKSWVAQIQAAGKKLTLGYFDDPDVAHATYLSAKRRLHAACTI